MERFNQHRVETFPPSDLICVDKSISRWYGQGGNWINHGLPMYVAIDRKPENGCEIQNSACGRSGVMLRLKLVKSVEEEQAQVDDEEAEENGGLLHGTVVCKHLVSPWGMSGRIVCGDSYFASVGTCRELKRMGLRFIGVVKTATRGYPMTLLSGVEMKNRGEHRAVVHKDRDTHLIDMIAFVWMDRDRRYFIANASCVAAGTPYQRKRWRQVVQDRETEPESVELTVPQPKACEIYYETCAMIDRHNRCRQDDLQVERKLGTDNWAMRLNLSLFSMCVVDCWLVYKAATETTEDQKSFYCALAEELVDNSYDEGLRAGRQKGIKPNGESPTLSENGLPRSGINAHLTPTKRKRKRSDGSETRYLLQGRCKQCGSKTTMTCSLCSDDSTRVNEPWICNTKGGRYCFSEHMRKEHQL